MKDLLTKKPEELKTLIKEKKQALQAFRFSLSGSKLKNVREGRGLRKEIAQALTVLRTGKTGK